MIDPRFYASLGAASASDIAAAVGLTVSRGDPGRLVRSAAASAVSGGDDLTFIDGPDAATGAGLRAGVCFASTALAAAIPASVTVIETPLARGAFAQAAARLVAPLEIEPGQGFVHPEARLAEGVRLGPGCVIGPGAAIGRDAQIGPNAVIHPGVQIGARARIGSNVSIRCALLGDDVTILSGAVIGEGGFGLAPTSSGAILTPHFGRVILQNGVSIGANSCIDRGLFEDTVIGEGAHIDNLCHIGHNSRIGSHTAMAAFAGVSGSVEVGDGVQFGGRVGIADHIKVGKGARIAAGSAVLGDVPAGDTHAGYPAKPIRTWMRELAWLARESQKRTVKDK